jgi:hypothetical protein
VAVWPVGYKEMTTGEIAQGFFRELLSASNDWYRVFSLTTSGESHVSQCLGLHSPSSSSSTSLVLLGRGPDLTVLWRSIST